jgi:hypothetical protein
MIAVPCRYSRQLAACAMQAAPSRERRRLPHAGQVGVPVVHRVPCGRRGARRSGPSKMQWQVVSASRFRGVGSRYQQCGALEDQHRPNLFVACGANLPLAGSLRDAQGRRVPWRDGGPNCDHAELIQRRVMSARLAGFAVATTDLVIAVEQLQAWHGPTSPDVCHDGVQFGRLQAACGCDSRPALFGDSDSADNGPVR